MSTSPRNDTGRTALLFTSLLGSVTLSVTSSDSAIAAGHQNAYRQGGGLANFRARQELRRSRLEANPLPVELPQPKAVRYHLAGTLPMMQRGLNNAEGYMRLNQRLDLSSHKSNVTLNNHLFNGSDSLTIDVGGQSKTFSSGSRATAAEFVALKQIAAGDAQSIKLDSKGVAIGGTFALDSVASQNVSRLVVPENVAGIENAGNDRNVDLGGSLVNFGSIYGMSTDAGVDAVNISARNIKNHVGASISTELPDGLAGGNLVDNLGLNINAIDSIVNHGRISSSRDLTLATANGAIENTAGTLPANSNGVADPQLPAIGANVLAARGDLNLIAGNGNVVNDGLVASKNGNINVSSPIDTTINITGSHGRFEAFNGDINVRDVSYQVENHINIVGGDYYSKNVNLYSGKGTITTVTGDLTGKLNTVSGIDRIYAQTATLRLSNNCVTGDPTFANFGGDIVIDGTNTFAEDVAILATGNVFADLGGNIINNGNDVTIIAGAKLTLGGSGGNNNASQLLSSATKIGAGSTVTVDFNAGTGGDVDLTGSGFFNLIDTSGTTAGAGSDGGNVTLVACAPGATGGRVLINSTSDILTYGTGSNGGGNVLIVAAAAPLAGQVVIQTGAIITGAGSFLTGVNPVQGNSGSITLSTAVPTNDSGGSTVTFNEFGQITGGQKIDGTFGGVGANAQIVTGELNATAPGMGNGAYNGFPGADAGNIFLRAGSDITTGNLIAYGQGGLGGFFDLNLGAGAGGNGGNGANVTLDTLNGAVTVNGFINTSGGGGGGGGGGSVAGFGPTTGGKGGAGGIAGDVNITAAGNVQVTGGILAADGGAGGAGGNGVAGDGGGGGGGGSLGGGGGGGGSNQINGGGGGGSGNFGGGGGQFVGGGGGGMQIGTPPGGFPGGGFFGGGTATDGSAGTGGNGSGGALGGTLFQGGQGGSGAGGGQSGTAGSAVNLVSGGGDVTVAGNALDLQGEVVGKDVGIATNVGSNNGYNIQQNITGTSSVSITADGTGAITRTGATTTVTAPTVNLFSGSGDIGPDSVGAIILRAVNLSVSTDGNVFLRNTGNVTVNASNAGTGQTFELLQFADAGGNGRISLSGGIDAGPGGTITLRSTESGTGTGGIVQISGTLSASNLNLSDGIGGAGTGDIGTSGSPIVTDTTSLTVNTKGNVNISNVGPVTLNSSTGNNFTLTDDDTVTTGGDTTVTGVLTLNVPSLNVQAGDDLTGASVLINGPLGGNLTIVNKGTINASAGPIDIISTPNLSVGGSVFIGGGGTMNALAGATNITAVMSGTDANVIEFIGDQIFNGSLNLNAGGVNQSVIVDNAVTATGNNTVVVNSPLLSLVGTGILTGNPLIFNPAGTIANSTGSIDLSSFGSLTFNGQSLAILAAGDITDNGNAVTVDLSSAGADGGTLTLIAGFDFTPATVGTVGPNATAYTITGAAAGSIDLGNTVINTQGAKNGGSVLAVANGSITLGLVQTAGQAGTSGDIDLKGNGINIINALTTANLITPPNSGDVDVFSGTVNAVGTVTVTNGSVTSGSFANGTASGDININVIGAGSSGDVTLTTGGTGAINGQSFLSKSLVAISGSGGIGQNAKINSSATTVSLDAGSANGSVNVNLLAATADLVGVNSGTQFIVTSQGNLNVVTNPVSNDLQLTAVNTLNFVSSSVNVTPDVSGNGGNLIVSADSITWTDSATKSLSLSSGGTGTGNGGTVTVETNDAVIIGNLAGHLNFTATSGATGGNGGIVDVEADSIDFDSAAINVGVLGTDGEGGKIFLTGENGITGSAAGAITLDASGKGTGAGGEIELTDNSATGFDIGKGVKQFTLVAQSGLTDGNGGSVSVSTQGAIVIDPAAILVNPTGSNGKGGAIILEGDSITNAVAANLKLDVSGVGIGTGGRVALKTVQPLNIGLTPTDISIVAESGKFGGSGGFVTLDTQGQLNLDTQALNFGPIGNNGSGGVLVISADTITWPTVATDPLVLDASAVGNGSGGVVDVTVLSAGTVNLGNNAGDIQLIAQSGTSSGDGGFAIFTASKGTVGLNPDAIQVGPLGSNGTGGTIDLEADLFTFTGNLSLSVDGKGTGSGGFIEFDQLAPVALIVGSGSGQVSFSATSGTAGGDGGGIGIKSGGSLSVDPTVLNVSVLGKEGNGGFIGLAADSDLVVSDSLSANGKGKTGAGGTIILISNSTKEFDIGSTDSGNGIAGGISVKGKPGGIISVVNAGGGVTNSEKLKAFTFLSMQAGGSGDLTVQGKVGDKNSLVVALVTAGTGDVVSTGKSSSVTATVLTITSGGDIGSAGTPLFISANDLDFTAAGLVNISNKAKGNIVVTGNNTGANPLSITSSSTIVVGGPLSGDTVNLTATGRAGIQPGLNGIVSGTVINLSAGNGGIGTIATPLAVSGVNSKTARTVTADSKGGIFLDSVGTGVLSLAGTETKKDLAVFADATLVLIGAVGTPKTASVLLQSEIGNILQGAGGSVNGKAVDLVALNGNIGVALAASVITNAPQLTFEAAGTVFINNQNTKTTVVGDSQGQSITLTMSGATTLNDLASTDGSISVIIPSGVLEVAEGAHIDVFSTGSGSLLLQNNDTAKGSIFIGANAKLETFTGSDGDINISIGAPQPPVAGTTPANVTEAGSGGGFFYSANGITANAPNNTLTVKNADIIFTNPLDASAIVLDGGVQITADPPAPGAMALTQSVSNPGSQPAMNLDSQPAPNLASQPLPDLASPVVASFASRLDLSSTSQQANLVSNTVPSPTPQAVSVPESSLADRISGYAVLSEVRSGVNLTATSQASAWISETELETGLIPAMVVDGNELGIECEITSPAELEEIGRPAAASRALSLKRGSIVCAPTVDTCITTPFGTVEVGSKAVVLIMASENGLSVFNLDDHHRHSVKLKSGRQELSLSPGRHASVSRSSITRFEHINPAQLFGYAGVIEHQLGNGLKAFTSEFSVAQALKVVLPFKQMTTSTNPKARKIMDHILKTTAIMMHVNGGNVRYEQLLRPSTVAWQQ